MGRLFVQCARNVELIALSVSHVGTIDGDESGMSRRMQVEIAARLSEERVFMLWYGVDDRKRTSIAAPTVCLAEIQRDSPSPAMQLILRPMRKPQPSIVGIIQLTQLIPLDVP